VILLRTLILNPSSLVINEGVPSQENDESSAILEEFSCGEFPVFDDQLVPISAEHERRSMASRGLLPTKAQ
jgi:hypothetical protein